MKEIKRGWEDFWAEFFRIRHRHSLKGIKEWDRKLVTHAIEACGLKKGDRILDLACGGGDQALEFARRGIEGVRGELAKSLVDYGSRAAQREKLPVHLIQGDMRNAQFSDEFDGCIILSGSFGFFDDEGNTQVLRVIEQALKNGGVFYIQLPNPLKKMRENWKGWDEVDDGYILMSSNYEPEIGMITDGFFYITNKGEKITFRPAPEDKDFSIETRVYTLGEMINLIKKAHLKFKAAYGSIELPFGKYQISSNNMIVVGVK